MRHQRHRNLGELKQKTGASQEQLAKIMGCSQGYVSKILAGKAQPSLQFAVHIARHMGVPIESLIKPIVADFHNSCEQ